MDEGVAGTVVEAEPAAAIAPVTGTATVAASARMGRRALRVMSLQTRAGERRTGTLGGRSPHLSPRTSEVQKGSDPSVPAEYKRGLTPSVPAGDGRGSDPAALRR